MTLAVWLGTAAPARTIRWLDGALAAAARLAAGGGPATAVAAGDPSWLDLAADRAARAGLPCTGIPTGLSLDYLGWAQVMAAAARHLSATTILVDEASRPERFPEVAAIAELIDAAQLTHVVALAPDGAAIRASRVTGGELQACRVRGTAVIGVRIAAAPVDEYPTPVPAVAMKRLDLAALGLDPVVLGHRALPPRAAAPQRRTVDRIADYLGVHVVPRGARRRITQDR